LWVHSAERIGIAPKFDSSKVNLTSKKLIPGWNPIGIPGSNTITAKDLLKPLGNSWSYILIYDAKSQRYRPVIINGANGSYSDDRLLYPAEAFWIYMNESKILLP
ncbi:MAG TPA: hypothetical protein VN372_15450, partial [Methanospirillum sp.]|nr:hypothetical protein [Methanospirillum sp.]